ECRWRELEEHRQTERLQRQLQQEQAYLLWKIDLGKLTTAPLKPSLSRQAEYWSHQCLPDQSLFPMATPSLCTLPCRDQPSHRYNGPTWHLSRTVFPLSRDPIPSAEVPDPAQKAWSRSDSDEVPPRVPVRTTSRSPVLSRRDSPLQGSGQQNSQAGQRNSTSSIEPRLLWERVEKLVPRPGSGSSSGSSNSGSQPGSHPGSQSGSGERFRVRSSSKSEGSPSQRLENAAKKPEDKKEVFRPLKPADLTALARELRAAEDVRPPHKVTDYSSSSEESGTTDEEDDDLEQEGPEEPPSGPEDARAAHQMRCCEFCWLSLGIWRGSSSLDDVTELRVTQHRQQSGIGRVFGNVSGARARPVCLFSLQSAIDQKRASHHESNGFAGRIHLLPDLLQQSHSSSTSSTSSSPSSSQPTPTMSPQTPQDKLTTNEEPEASRLPRQARHQIGRHRLDGPQIVKEAGGDRDIRRRFVRVSDVTDEVESVVPRRRRLFVKHSVKLWAFCVHEIGVNLLVGTESGLMLLDRSGQGKVYPLINRRRFQQMDVLEGLNVLVTISGKKDKLRVYYLSWLRNKILHNDPEVEKKQGWTTVGDLEGCVHYKVGKFHDGLKYERIKFLVIALKSSVEVYAWAPKPYHKFMAFKSFGDLVHKPLLVDLTVEEGQRLKVIYGSCAGFHAVDVDSGSVYDIYLPTHIQCSIKPHAIIILPNTDGMELLVCYEDEGVYVNTYGRITKDVVLQWGEMPTSVAYIRSNQTMGWGEKAIEIRSVETGHLDGVFMHKRAQRLKFLCERNDKVFFASVRSGGSSQVYFMTLGRTSLLSW
ncbi:hypothetical protein E2I00_004368, partial [Balaenoptera physalus]